MDFYDQKKSKFTKANHTDIIQTIKPIETCYLGYRFRSRLEARWAVALHELNINFVYEPDGYELLSGSYLPDFWLPYPESRNFSGFPNAGHFFEVKGKEPTQKELTNLLLLSIGTNHSGILVWGSPWDFKKYFTHRSGNCGWSSYDPDEDPAMELLILLHRFTENSNYEEAITKARQARFEFGENG